MIPYNLNAKRTEAEAVPEPGQHEGGQRPAPASTAWPPEGALSSPARVLVIGLAAGAVTSATTFGISMLLGDIALFLMGIPLGAVLYFGSKLVALWTGRGKAGAVFLIVSHIAFGMLLMPVALHALGGRFNLLGYPNDVNWLEYSYVAFLIWSVFVGPLAVMIGANSGMKRCNPAAAAILPSFNKTQRPPSAVSVDKAHLDL